MSQQRSIGGHVSAAGGISASIQRALDIKANSLQLFVSSPRRWEVKDIPATEIKKFLKLKKEKDIWDVFVHALYLNNLASDNKEIVQKSKKSLISTLKICSKMRVNGVVVHLGSHQGRGWEVSRDQVALLIQNIIDEAGVKIPFLIENSAGQKGKINSDLAEISWLLNEVQRPTLGWCYDSCHGWAAGYAVKSAEQIEGKEKSLWAEVEQYDLWGSLGCLHINDSKDDLGSGRDRHENIGEGKIPEQQLQDLVTHPRWQNVPIITEAPGFDGHGPDAENIKRLQKLIY